MVDGRIDDGSKLVDSLKIIVLAQHLSVFLAVSDYRGKGTSEFLKVDFVLHLYNTSVFICLKDNFGFPILKDCCFRDLDFAAADLFVGRHDVFEQPLEVVFLKPR